MSVLELFSEFRANELQVGVVGNNLQIVDVKGNLNDSLREKIRLHKQEIIDILLQDYELDYADFEYSHLDKAAFSEIAKKYPAIETLFPASALQQGMFYQEASEGNSSAYNRQLYFNLGAEVDLDGYFSAWQNVVNSNEMLKACFTGFDTDEIHVVVPEKVTLPIEIVDYSITDDVQLESALAELTQREKIRTFDYSVAPLMRLVAVRMPDLSHRIIWTYHHAILDGWSLPIVVDAVDADYRGARDATTTPSYMEYFKWVASSDEQKAEAYWRDCFSRYDYQALPLGNAKPEGIGRTVEKSVITDDLLGKNIIAWAAENRTTINCVLHTAWSLVLQRYFNLAETVVGSVVSIRPPSIENVDKIPGLLINTIPVRLCYSNQTTLDTIIAQANQQNIAAMDYGNYPLNKIKKIAGCGSNQELFESLIVFYNYPLAATGGANYSANGNEIQASGFSEESNFPITVLGSRQGDGLVLSIKYNSAQIVEQLSEDLVSALRNVLVQIVAGEFSRKLDQISLVDVGQLKPVPVIKPLDAVAFPIRSGLKGLLQYIANQNAKSVAIEYEDESYTYAELDQKTNKLARFIKSSVPDGNARVAILLDRSLGLVEAVLACVKASIPVLLLDPKEPATRSIQKLKVANVDVLFSHSDFAENFQGAGYTFIDLDAATTLKHIHKENGKTIPSDPAAEAQDTVFLSVETNLDADVWCREIFATDVFEKLCVYNKIFGSKVGQVRALSAAIQSDWFGFGILSSACNAHHLVLINEATDLLTNDLLDVSAVQVTAGELSGLLNRKYSFRGIKQVDVYGGHLGDDDINKLRKYSSDISINVFASTDRNYLFELCTQLSVSISDAPKALAAVSNDVGIYVLDGGFNPLPTGATGWLCHKLPNGEVLRTTQMAVQLPDGSIEFVDSSYQYYFSDGQKIYFSEVEKALKSVSGVVEAVVMVRDDAEYERGSRLVAYLLMENKFVESLNGYTDNEEYYDEVYRIKRQLSPYVPKSMIPDTFVFMEDLSKNDHQVSVRKNLPSPDKINKARRHHEEPADDIERKILTLWEGGFLLNGLSVTDEYFDLGGSSLLQIKLLNLINKEFLIQLTWEDLFHQKSTVRTQASRIKQELGSH